MVLELSANIGIECISKKLDAGNRARGWTYGPSIKPFYMTG